MIRSMTGFGSAAGRVGSVQVTVELRTVNHRFFNPNLKLPSALARWESEVRETLRRGIARGHVTMSARLERSDDELGAGIDDERFAQYVGRVRALQSQHGLADDLDAGTILRLPGVITSDVAAQEPGTAEEMMGIVSEALASLTAMREAEGERLVAALQDRVDLIAAGLERIAARAPERLAVERERLRSAVRDLADGVDLDAGRLAQELAVLADKLDVSEEIDRFRAHLAAFRGTLNSKGEPVGKRLGFILQEMLREANTIGSKARDAVMLHDVVGIKEELERIAEQVENLE